MFVEWRKRLSATCDPASVELFRMAFGVLLAVSAVRFIANGWVERFFAERTFFFHYPGFAWVKPWPLWGMYLHYGAIALCSLLLAVGFCTRLSSVLLFVLFTYAELIDVTNYLNHYYLVSLLLLWLCVLPVGRSGSVDAWLAQRTGWPRAPGLPLWTLWTLRVQVACVYIHAGLAKLGSDWLWHGQPLNLWLNARRDLPWVGDWLAHPYVALGMGWAGILHDLCVVPLLLYPRTRVFGYVWLLAFHFGTHTLFNIGIFPFLMPLAATLFFAPEWPRRAWQAMSSRAAAPPVSEYASGRSGPRSAGVHRSERPRDAVRQLSGLVAAVRSPFRKPGTDFGPRVLVLVGCLAFQVLWPLRTHLYGGNVLWHEQGMRWSWRVMVREKQGSITYRATLPSGREVDVSPRKYLSSAQEREMSGQPDLILQLGQHIGRELARRTGAHVPVRVDALVSLNGRRVARLIDPEVDLTQVRDSLAPADWILKGPEEAPPALGERRMAIRR